MLHLIYIVVISLAVSSFFIKSETQDSIIYPAPTLKPILTEASSSASPSATPASVAKVIEPDKPTKVLAAVTKKQTESSKVVIDNPKSIQNILDALNSYREKRGISKLSLNPTLAEYAKFRVSHFVNISSIDNHEGFKSFIQNEDGFNKLGFMSLGENSGNGNFSDGTDLVEKFYGSHGPHDQNQLDPKWTHAGIAVSGNFTDFIFGANKI